MAEGCQESQGTGPLAFWGVAAGPGLFSLEEGHLWENLTAATSSYGETIQKTDPGYSQCCIGVCV